MHDELTKCPAPNWIETPVSTGLKLYQHDMIKSFSCIGPKIIWNCTPDSNWLSSKYKFKAAIHRPLLHILLHEDDYVTHPQ